MSREIKFRAWDKKHKSLFPVRGYWWEEEGCNEYDLSKGFGYGDYELMQYTGLKDKNGKEIYEGDIVKCDQWYYDYKTEGWKLARDGKEKIGHIWYANPCNYIAEWAVSFNHLYSECSTTFDNLRNVEIVGNIHENPELLKS